MRDLLSELTRESAPRRRKRTLEDRRPRERKRSEVPSIELNRVVRERLGPSRPASKPRPGGGVARWGEYRLAADSVEALRVTGAFGTVGLRDLEELYTSPGRARRSVRELQAAGLLRIERFRRGQRSLRAVTLTRRGVRLLKLAIDPRDKHDVGAQAYLGGPARPSQVQHDVAVYRAAREETRRVEASGGRVRRVVTEGELQAQASRAMHEARSKGSGLQRARRLAAAKVDLRMVNGRLAFPDVRLETAGRDGCRDTARHIDVEVVTRDYRQASLRAKGSAGFVVYRAAADGSVSRTPGIGT